jgi:phosphoserine phosphatase
VALVDGVRSALTASGADVGDPRVLAEGIAGEIEFAARSVEASATAARAAAAYAAVDCVLLPVADRRKRLLVADLESTLIGQECLEELASYVGKRRQIAEITGRAMRGEIDFEGALRERVAMLRGLPESALMEVFERRVGFNPGAETLVATMQASGATVAIVSGGFTFFTSRIRARLGCAYDQGNRLEIVDGRMTGNVLPPVLGRDAKRQALVTLAAERGLRAVETMAVGDGANDLDMLAAAGLGVAYHAKPAVAAAARCRIDHGDLTALLYLQGYRREEFAHVPSPPTAIAAGPSSPRTARAAGRGQGEGT